MVMETPSAQCVGREFVRQYYTLLHEAPDYLHRFYSHNSCFVHGGVEKPGEEQPPVTGQADIHKKIMSLKFQDCHAKIRQVDSQATVGNAVVVQVTGELSNNCQPMRRFMQTFLLAPQTPKKYYVHNDIFRYQDEVFHDLDGGVDTSGAPTQLSAVSQQDASQEQDCEEEEEESGQDAQQSEPDYYDAPQQSEPATLSNGTGAAEPAEEEEEDQPEDVSGGDDQPAAFEAAIESAAQPEEEAPQPEPVVTRAPEPVQQQQPQEPQKPVSWAALASQRPAQQQGGIPAAQQQAPRPALSAPIKPSMDAASKGPAGPIDAGKPQGQRAPRPPRGERTARDNSRSAPGADGTQDGNNMDPRNQQQQPPRLGNGPQGQPQNKYSDAHQLFVGNLPHNTEEQELKDFFEKDYGKVVEVRINRKSSSTRDVPNFGFVVFASPDTVQKVLQMRPILLRDDIRLNVEEKKQRGEQGGRPGSGTRMGGRGGGQGMMGGGRGGQGGGMGARGGGRGGAGGPPRGAQSGGRGGGGGFRGGPPR